MSAIIQRTSLAFAALSIAAPSAALLLPYATYHWDESLVLGCLAAGVGFWLALLAWSIWSVHRHRVRAVAGSLVCAYCLWQILHVMSKW
jgi:hypothetical protein